MTDPLPNEFDVIVLGTGLPESVIAAACARLGQTVLHLDKNDYYGGSWASFNFEALQKWAECQSERKESGAETVVASESVSALLREGERLEPVCKTSNPFIQINWNWHIKSETEFVPQDRPEEESDEEEMSDEPAAESAVQKEDSDENKNSESAEPTKETVEKEWRRFSLDLTPKVLCSRGQMVELLVSSGVGRYAEFKCVDRILTIVDEQIKKVPCSRADVFQTQEVSMVEKRKLMKFLTFCLNHESERESYTEFENRSFVEYLEYMDLTPLLRHYILNALAMVPVSATTCQGLNAVSKFLHSVGRFGNSPFLWTLYGSGELPQCFCRLCAVFGGVYCLRRSVEFWIVDESNGCVGIVSEGQRLGCRYLVADSDYVPLSLLSAPDPDSRKMLQRAVLITDSSLLADDPRAHVSLLNLPQPDGQFPVRLLELPPASMVCPPGFYVVQVASCGPEAPHQRLLSALEDLFRTSSETESDIGRPRVLWSLTFGQQAAGRQSTLSNVAIVPPPDPSLDYDSTVRQTKHLFETLWPGAEFLPHFPAPDESSDSSSFVSNGFIPDPV